MTLTLTNISEKTFKAFTSKTVKALNKLGDYIKDNKFKA